MKLVYIHGIAQERKDRNVLQAEWDKTLRAGLSAAQEEWPAGWTSTLPYYGNMLADKTAEVDRDEAMGLVPRGLEHLSENAKMLEFYVEMYTDIAQTRGARTVDLLDENGRPVERGWQNNRYVLAVARWLNRFEPIAAWTIDTFTRDVWVYLHYNRVRLPLHAIVDAEIPRDDPCILVSHSLGTVIAYNVIDDRPDRENIKAWITLGSPLGVEAIYSRLPSSVVPKPRRAPAGVRTWYNARDPHDPVALHPVPAQFFGGSPQVQNASHVKNKTDNQHGIAGYLNDVEVSRTIAVAARV